MTCKNVLNHQIPIEKYFEEISRIPRGIRAEKAVSDYVVSFAEARGLSVYQDEHWNVIVKKPAGPGGEGKAPLALQAHLDMVHAKTAESCHDFEKEPIELVLTDGILTAKDTTLGTDDGFGVSYILAILDDDSLSHPPLECIFTVQEESNNEGAQLLDKSKISADRMIGLDGDAERSTFVSCFCSDRLVMKKAYNFCSPQGKAYAVTIDELSMGVYQGVCHQECGNAIKMMARVLRQAALCGISLQIASWEGGKAENQNPFFSKAVIYTDSEETKLSEVLDHEFALMMEEFEDERYVGRLTAASCMDAPGNVLSASDSRAVLDLVYLMPSNLFHAADGGASASVNNIGVIRVEDGFAELIMSARSKHFSMERHVLEHCRMIGALYGFSVQQASRYSPWPYNKDSALRKLANQITLRESGFTMEEEVCPGGLELGWFFDGKPQLDVIQLGPDLENLHTPDERMDMESFHRVYALVCRMLAEIE